MLEEFGEHDRKVLRCPEQSVSGKLDVSDLGRSERSEQGRESTYPYRECSQCFEGTVGRNMDTKVATGRAQKEMRMVLATGGNGTLVLQLQRA